MIDVDETPSSVLGGQLRTVSPRALGATGLGAGLIALATVVLGSTSWMLLGTAHVAWILSGWALFVGPNPRRPVVAALGSFLLLSATVAAFAVLVGVYLAALGPSWVP